jgi:hypothetical protein
MTPQDGGMPMTALIRRTTHLVEVSLDDLLAVTGCGKA